MSNIPSIAMIPSAYKSGKVYSVLPSDGSGDLNFARASEATRVNENGLIEKVGSNVPRIDYTDGGCPKLLLEPQITNLVTYSEDFSNASWTTLASGETIVSNSVISPNGTLNADTLEGDGTSTNVYVRKDITLNTSVDYTFSIFAKKGTNDFLAISAEGFTGATNTLLIFDLNNSTVTNGTGNIKDYGNGWLRCSFTTAISTDGVGRFLIYPAYNGTTRSFPTSSDANGQNIYIYGAQLEQQSYPTSYIPTSGFTVTREAETASKTGLSNYINSSEGVLYAEISALADDGTSRSISLSDGTYNNSLILQYRNISSTISIKKFTTILSTFSISDAKNNLKIAINYSSNNIKIYLNGFLIDTNNTFTSFPSNTLSELNFDRADGGEDFYGNVKQLQYFDTALSDEELALLTSL